MLPKKKAEKHGLQPMKTPSAGPWALGYRILSLGLSSLGAPSMWRGNPGLPYVGALLCMMSKQEEKDQKNPGA